MVKHNNVHWTVYMMIKHTFSNLNSQDNLPTVTNKANKLTSVTMISFM